MKLYRDLLTSESWVLGTDHSRLLQVASVLLAARYDNKIPLRWDLIKKVASLDMTEAQFKTAIQHLAEHNFVEIQAVPSETNAVVHSASTALATCTSETEAEKRQSREETEQNRSVELKLDDGPIERVFEHWRSEWKHPKAVLDPKRRRTIQAALKLHDELTLCASISGYRNSPHHLGENEQRTTYDDISLFLRDATHVEAGLRFARGPPAPAMSAVEKARAKLREQMNGHGRVVSEQSGTGDSGVGPVAGVLR